MPAPRIGLVAGEASGDLLGAGLIRAVRERFPDAEFMGVAGPEMQAAGCEAWYEAEALAVMGLIEPLTEIPRLLAMRRDLVRRFAAAPPDVFVGIDAPDFNLGLEKRLRSRGIRTAHYVSPSVWAWRQGRVKKIAAATDLVLCLLPFEKAFFDRHGIAAEFVGHPMADREPAITDPAPARERLGLSAPTVLCVMPGSRASEVSRLGPVFAAACAELAGERPIGFVAPMATPKMRALFEAHLDAAGMREAVTLTDGNAELAIAAADVVLLASGTASLQAALLGRPMVAAYRLQALTYAIAKGLKLVKVKYFTLPNLLTEEPLVPELLQGAATPERLAAEVRSLLDDDARRETIRARFLEVRDALRHDADARAADAVLQLVAAPG